MYTCRFAFMSCPEYAMLSYPSHILSCHPSGQEFFLSVHLPLPEWRAEAIPRLNKSDPMRPCLHTHTVRYGRPSKYLLTPTSSFDLHCMGPSVAFVRHIRTDKRGLTNAHYIIVGRRPPHGNSTKQASDQQSIIFVTSYDMSTFVRLFGDGTRVGNAWISELYSIWIRMCSLYYLQCDCSAQGACASNTTLLIKSEGASYVLLSPLDIEGASADDCHLRRSVIVV
ncbi:hypothetical protein BDN71DRAFT_271733 [Pleurotus eryngii]|uniref:Uncharacterized protein n=1 Tax=Pleurotus eryngii TaxID=5323 RepID=A0A9P6DAA4_PLEER|nr:hypothetical protein BDN71DRAFT_271733 [Pleurotus eryngii]